MRALADAGGSAANGGRWSDLRLRVLSAAVLLPLALAALWVGGWAWAALVVLATLLMAREWMDLWTAPPRPALVAGGWAYLALAAAAMLWLRGDAVAGRGAVLFVLLVVWSSDIGAYLVGRLVGGPRLAPQISPGKTWSGAAGGLLAAALVGASAGAAGIALAVLLGLAAQAGDLLESLAKRRAGVKDSGRLIPGHGGLLDRLDGVLAAGPAAALLALALGRGGLLWQ